MEARMPPCMVRIFTNLPAHSDARTGEDFAVLADKDA
jgi:hypothetical protein